MPLQNTDMMLILFHLKLKKNGQEIKKLNQKYIIFSVSFNNN